MAEHGRFQIELAAYGLPDVFQAVVFGVGDAGCVGFAFQRGGAVVVGEVSELVVDAAEIVEQLAQVVHIAAAVLFRIHLQRLAAALHRARQPFAVTVGPAAAQAFGYVAAGLPLHFEQAADAENQVGVF